MNLLKGTGGGFETSDFIPTFNLNRWKGEMTRGGELGGWGWGVGGLRAASTTGRSLLVSVRCRGCGDLQ